MGSRLAREIARHESVVKKRSLRLYELYRKAADKRKAAEIIDAITKGRLTYEQALRELERLARG